VVLCSVGNTVVAAPLQELGDVQSSLCSAQEKSIAFDQMVLSSQVIPAATVDGEQRPQGKNKRTKAPITKETRVPTRQLYEALSNVLRSWLGCSFGIGLLPVPFTPVQSGQLRLSVPLMQMMDTEGLTNVKQKFYKYNPATEAVGWDSVEELQNACKGGPCSAITLCGDEGSTGWSLFWYLVHSGLLIKFIRDEEHKLHRATQWIYDENPLTKKVYKGTLAVVRASRGPWGQGKFGKQLRTAGDNSMLFLLLLLAMLFCVDTLSI
jgi:hypothetical protein